MKNCPPLIDLGTLANIVTIITAIVLVIYFFYVRHINLVKNYLQGFKGLYSGIVHKGLDEHSWYVNMGIVLYIKKASNQIILGELEYVEKLSKNGETKFKSAGIVGLYGKMELNLMFEETYSAPISDESLVINGELTLCTPFNLDKVYFNSKENIIGKYNVKHYVNPNIIELNIIEKGNSWNEKIHLKRMVLIQKTNFFMDKTEFIVSEFLEGKSRLYNEFFSTNK